jgi:6-phosphogluconolactonase/glucosamine-6-phosphate isomerase/deaminase
MSIAVHDLLEQAKRLTGAERLQLLEALQLLVATESTEVPDWHLKKLDERLAVPDDDTNTVSAQAAWDLLDEVIKRPRGKDA